MNPQLNEWNLPHGVEPHNPDGLTPEQITEGGKWRACAKGDWSEVDYTMPKGTQVRLSGLKAWSKPSDNRFFHPALTYRVPITTPLPAVKESLTPQPATGQSKTPRTDGIWELLKLTWNDKTYREQFFAAKEGAYIGIEDLETELTAALAERDEARRLLGEAKASPVAVLDEGLLEWLSSECFDLRCEEVRGYDDSDNIWVVYSHHMDAPKLRREGQGRTAVEAVRDAMLPKGDPRRWDYVPDDIELI